MKLRRAEVAVIALVILSFFLGIFFYPRMPERVASHWNARGQVDGYMSRTWGVFLMPIALLGIALLFFLIPRIDPLRANIEKFRKHYDGFVILFFLFMISIQLQGLLWNVGVKVSPSIVFPIGLGLLIFYAGILTSHAKRNWFIGIRTPWTLSSDEVWDKTHRLGGTLLKVAGAIVFLGVFFKDYVVWFVLIPSLAAAVWSMVYSYVEYRKRPNDGGSPVLPEEGQEPGRREAQPGDQRRGNRPDR